MEPHFLSLGIMPLESMSAGFWSVGTQPQDSTSVIELILDFLFVTKVSNLDLTSLIWAKTQVESVQKKTFPNSSSASGLKLSKNSAAAAAAVSSNLGIES